VASDKDQEGHDTFESIARGLLMHSEEFYGVSICSCRTCDTVTWTETV
jgi:ferredoxin-thioredoxin reductase catalytic subunit